jgi:hypothetical protein
MRFRSSVRQPVALSRLVTLGLALPLIACGKEAKQAAENASNVASVVAASGKMAEATDEATKFQEARKAKGDTVPMDYKALQAMLVVPDGYTADGGPEGSSTAMAGFAMSEAKQKYVGPAGADGTTPRIDVDIIDFGGSQMGYSMLAMPMMMNLSQEDDKRRMRTVKLGPEYTWASEEYDKQDHSSKVTAVTRYRYVVTVNAQSQTSDQSAAVTKFTEQVVKKFDGK